MTDKLLVAPQETITIDDEIWTADDIHELIKSRDTYAIWKRDGDLGG